MMIKFKYSNNQNEADKIRKAVFLDEQRFSTEFDELDDPTWTYITAYQDEEAVGLVRVKAVGDIGYLGRLAVLSKYRRKGYGELLVKEAEKVLKHQGVRIIKLHAQEPKINFYNRCGYIGYGEFEMDEYMPHLWMMKEVKNESN